jgi:hypothetical protein
MLVGAERPGLFEQTVDERRLAMVHVSDNGYIPDMLHLIHVATLKNAAKELRLRGY